ncbi:MAG: iron dicitrate transport regulator FecR [Planctomycetaceae bacterium]|nr:iron dicitrate transport regulator FecR [Planctomycetaceae bacterium]
MNDDSDLRATLDAWLIDVREARATPDETARISQMLSYRPDLQKYVATRLIDEVLLREELQVAAAESLLGEHIVLPAETPAPPRRSISWRAVGYGVVFSLCSVALAWLLFGNRGGPNPIAPDGGVASSDPAPEVLSDTEGVAVLTHAVNVTWGLGVAPIRVGERIAFQSIRIESGYLQVEFFSGVTVVIEGPAEFDVTSPSRCRCRRGKVRVAVPPPATGFTVNTGEIDAVDLGTEFAIRAAGDGTGEVHVLNGKVDMRRVDGAGNRVVAGGRAVQFGAGSGVAELPARPDDFVGAARLRAIKTTSSEVSHRRWTDHSRRWAEDPTLAMYFTFDGQGGADRHLIGKAPAGASLPDGAIVGCRWTEGRFSGKGALEFKRTSDRVRVNVAGEFESMTLLVWLRVDGLEQWYNSLLLADGYPRGKVHWQLTGEGALKLSVSGGGSYITRPVIKPSHLGTWVQLASVYDHDRRLVTHYFDGEAVATGRISADPPLSFGSAEIGNWNPLRPSDTAIRSLNGTIDEFAVFRRALSREEIAQSFRAGKP